MSCMLLADPIQPLFDRQSTLTSMHIRRGTEVETGSARPVAWFSEAYLHIAIYFNFTYVHIQDEVEQMW
jgi:hypothetical protein